MKLCLMLLTKLGVGAEVLKQTVQLTHVPCIPNNRTLWPVQRFLGHCFSHGIPIRSQHLEKSNKKLLISLWNTFTHACALFIVFHTRRKLLPPVKWKPRKGWVLSETHHIQLPTIPARVRKKIIQLQIYPTYASLLFRKCRKPNEYREYIVLQYTLDAISPSARWNHWILNAL